jgi:hypothetical protein
MLERVSTLAGGLAPDPWFLHSSNLKRLTHSSKVHVRQSAGKVIEEGFVFSFLVRAGDGAEAAFNRGGSAP